MDWKKIKKYSSYGLYLIPFAGAIIEYYKPKEKKTKFGTVLSILNIAVPLAKIAVLTVPYMIHKNYQDKTFQEKNKNKLEQIIETKIDTNNIPKDKQVINYEELLVR